MVRSKGVNIYVHSSLKTAIKKEQAKLKAKPKNKNKVVTFLEASKIVARRIRK